MDDVTQRLIGCFQIVFPDLPASDIPRLSQAAAANWDSVAAITLMNVLEDEFSIEMDLDQVAELDSFDKLHTYVQQRLQAA